MLFNAVWIFIFFIFYLFFYYIFFPFSFQSTALLLTLGWVLSVRRKVTLYGQWWEVYNGSFLYTFKDSNHFYRSSKVAPNFNFSLFWNIKLMYLLTSLINWGVVGHIRVLNLSSSEKPLNPCIIKATFSNRQLRVFLNTSQNSKKCCSESTNCLLPEFESPTTWPIIASGSGLVWQ